MARTREIKAQFFTDGKVRKLPIPARYLFQALWCLADREGRLADDPDDIEVYVGDIGMTIDEALDALHPHFITRYEIDGARYIQVNNFAKHQHIHPREVASQIPPIPVPVREKANLGEPFHGEATPRREIMPMPSMPSMPSGSSVSSMPSATATSSVTLDSSSGSDEMNPFGDSKPLAPTIESYIADKLATPINRALVEDLTDYEAQGLETEAVRYAVDIALNAGSPTWRFTRAVIRDWLAKGVKTLDGAKAAQKQHDAAKVKSARASPTQVFDPYKIMNTPDRYKNDSEDIIEQWEREKRERAAGK